MKRVKVLTALVMALTLLFGSSISVLAATDVSVDADSKTGTCDSTFTATAENLGGGLVVSIPADLDLTWKEANSKYQTMDYVSAKGNIAADKKVNISVPTAISYALTSSALTTVTGTAMLNGGTAETKNIDAEEVNVSRITYTAEQVRASNLTADNRDIIVYVNADDIPVIGEYKATVNFYIDVVNAE